MQEQGLWRITEVAQYLGVPLSSVYKMTSPTGRLRIPHVRIAGRLRFRKADIDRWLEVLTVSNTEKMAKFKERIGQRIFGNGLHP